MRHSVLKHLVAYKIIHDWLISNEYWRGESKAHIEQGWNQLTNIINLSSSSSKLFNKIKLICYQNG